MNSQPGQLRIGRRLAWASLMVVAIAGVSMFSHAADAPKGASPDDVVRKHLAKGLGVSEEDFDPSFLKLDTDNQKLLDGEDVLDSDPVCQCQDTVGKYRVTGKPDGVDRYVAIVGKVGGKSTWQVILQKINGAWKIYDVVDQRGSVRALLERHNACAREKIAHHQDVDVCSLIK